MRRPLALLLFMFSMLWLGTLPPFTLIAAGNAPDRCFPETGQCLSGRFRQFWEQNGGLALFGYPLGPVQAVQRQDLNYVFYGPEIYLVQRFERVRMELHPENAPPYEVLLGSLGQQLVPTPRLAGQGPPADCRWFTMTGYFLCDQAPGQGFKHYWEQHGLLNPLLDADTRSLALFGYPLTGATLERNPTDGRTYLTQWFERARLEWHPELPPPYQVLAGLLGREDPQVFSPMQLAPQPVQYLWPTQLPAGIAVLPTYSSFTTHGYLLALGTGEQVQGYLSAGALASTTATAPPPDALIPPPSVDTPITVGDQAGRLHRVPDGQVAIWQVQGVSYALSFQDGPLEHLLTQAHPFAVLEQATWLQRLGR